VVVAPARRALDEGAQRRLWERSVELTGVEPALPPQAEPDGVR
jgi:hypothetical protein